VIHVLHLDFESRAKVEMQLFELDQVVEPCAHLRDEVKLKPKQRSGGTHKKTQLFHLSARTGRLCNQTRGSYNIHSHVSSLLGCGGSPKGSPSFSD
jgi:hypothetical protein